MPAMEFMPTPFDPVIDRLSNKIQEIRERKTTPADASVNETMDDAMDMVSSNLGRQEAREAQNDMQGLSMEMIQQGAEAHSLDPTIVASLIADPFEE